MFAAVLDTCVLWPSLQRDFLLSLAVEGLYRPLWSEAILEEIHRHEYYKLMDWGKSATCARAAADHLLTNMRDHFGDASVSRWEPLEGSFGLADTDDEHVVAAAVVGGAGAIVTDNLKHFPPDQVPSHIHVLPAHTFAANTTNVDPERAARALWVMSERRQKTRQSPHELVDLLRTRYGMGDVANAVLPVLEDAAPPFS